MHFKQIPFEVDLVVPNDAQFPFELSVQERNTSGRICNVQNRFVKAVCFLFDVCTVSADFLCFLTEVNSLKRMLALLCHDNEQVIHVHCESLKEVLLQNVWVVGLCHIEYLHGKVDCVHVDTSYATHFLDWLFKKERVECYIPVVFTEWHEDGIVCEVFSDFCSEELVICPDDLRYFSTLWTYAHT